MCTTTLQNITSSSQTNFHLEVAIYKKRGYNILNRMIQIIHSIIITKPAVCCFYVMHMFLYLVKSSLELVLYIWFYAESKYFFLILSYLIYLVQISHIYVSWWKWLVWFIVFNTTFSNMSVISWRSVLLVKETKVPGENHWPVASHWQTLSHNVVSSTSRHELHKESGNEWYESGYEIIKCFEIWLQTAVME